jgi:hypothetical protein
MDDNFGYIREFLHYEFQIVLAHLLHNLKILVIQNGFRNLVLAHLLHHLKIFMVQNRLHDLHSATSSADVQSRQTVALPHVNSGKRRLFVQEEIDLGREMRLIICGVRNHRSVDSSHVRK